MSIPVQQYARPYANAAFEWSQALNQEASWLSALQLLATFFSDVNLKTTLFDPRVGALKVTEVLIDVLGPALDVPQQNFVKLLAKQRRFNLIPCIARLFADLVAASQNTLRVFVSSAFTLSEHDQQRLIVKLQEKYQKNIDLQWQLEPSLMGGIQIKVGDEVIDASIRGKLHQFEVALNKSA